MRITKAAVALSVLVGGVGPLEAQLQSGNAQEWMQGYTLPGVAESNDHLGGVYFAIGLPSDRSNCTGDFNGDGYLDLAIGVPLEDPGSGRWTGIVHVVYGGSLGLDPATAVTLSQGSGGLLDSAEAEDMFGSALASGDFDADGVDDLAIGVPGEKLLVNLQGVVHIVYGGKRGGLSDRDALLYQGQFANTDQAENWDFFGRTLAVGDFNGDGIDDLAAAAISDDVQGAQHAGLVVVCLARAGQGLGNPVCQVLTQDRIPGGVNEPSDLFGWAMAAGDFNGDDRDDLALGTPWEDVSSVKDAGLLTVVYGSPWGLDPGVYQTFNQQTLGEVFEANDELGYELVSGDFNGDRVDDLAVSAPYESLRRVSRCGILHTLYGKAAVGLDPGGSLNQDTQSMADSNEPSDRFGLALVAGDFDADGFLDLAIGVPGESNASGAVSVVNGSLFGLHPFGNQWWTQDSPGLTSYPEAGDFFGGGLTAGDFDGNGAADLTISVESEDGGPNQTNCGIAHTLYGN